MTIFNINIWGEDADAFMALSCAKKKEWIKNNTNQQSDELIEEFLKYHTRGVDGQECDGCKEAKNETNKPNSVSAGIAEPQTENKAAIDENNTAGPGETNRKPKRK